jgi:site-specific DNA recombinase
MTSVAIYCRVSTTQQAEEGISLQAQETRVRGHCQGAGLDVAGVYVDNCSGKIHPTKRPAMARALADIRAGQASGLAFLRFERVSRKSRDIMELAEQFRARGWRLISVTEQLDTGTPVGLFVLGIFAGLAQLEREQIGLRTKEAMAQLAREGKRRSRFAPLGFTFAAGKLVAHPPEQPIVVKIMALASTGAGPRVVARWLNEAGIRHPRTGGLWSPSTMAKTLRSMARRTG